MRSIVFRFVCVIFSAALLSSAGCGGSKENPPDVLVPVSGTVKVNGQPAPGVVLTFLPEASTSGTGGYAATDDQGNFTVTHRTSVPGIEPGSYKVLASRMLQPNGQPVPSGESAMDLNATESLPARYTDPEQTPFRPTISADSSEPLSFEISTK